MIADPLWSCVMLLCGSIVGPLRSVVGLLRSFAVFSHTPYVRHFSRITTALMTMTTTHRQSLASRGGQKVF